MFSDDSCPSAGCSNEELLLQPQVKPWSHQNQQSSVESPRAGGCTRSKGRWEEGEAQGKTHARVLW